MINHRVLTKAAIGRKKARGEKTGGDRPYGYKVEGGRLVPDDKEQAILACIQERRREGASLRGIVAALKAEGFTTRVGTPCCLTQMALLVSRHPVEGVAS
jgi:DNA invertase Pin-like site-specific DNA recombinase